MTQSSIPIGASTFCLLFLPWREAVEQILAEGFSAAELFGDAPQAHFTQLDASDRRVLKSVASRCDLSLHAPTFELNIASANPGAQAEAVRQYQQAVRLGAEIGATLLVVHEGHMSYWRLDRQAAQHAAIDGLGKVVTLAKQEGVTIALENTNFGKFAMYETWQEWIGIAADLNEPTLRLTLDTGHAQIAGWDIAAVIRALAAQIAQIHISDNKGAADDHLLPGEGVVNWQAIAQAVRETGCGATWILESGPFASVADLRTGKARMEQLLD
jgi:sugar phosphate isomerase/epimerase